MKKLLIAGAISLSSISAFAETSSLAEPMASDNQFNVTVSPIVALIGMVAGEAQYAATSNVTVGPKLAYWGLDLGGDSISLYSIGAVSQYNFGGNYQDGGYFKTTAGYTGVSIETENSNGVTCEASGGLTGLGALAGYQWFWDSGFNTNLGAGYSFNIGDISAEATCTDGTTTETASESTDAGAGGLALEWNLGYSF